MCHCLQKHRRFARAHCPVWRGANISPWLTAMGFSCHLTQYDPCIGVWFKLLLHVYCCFPQHRRCLLSKAEIMLACRRKSGRVQDSSRIAILEDESSSDRFRFGLALERREGPLSSVHSELELLGHIQPLVQADVRSR